MERSHQKNLYLSSILPQFKINKMIVIQIQKIIELNWMQMTNSFFGWMNLIFQGTKLVLVQLIKQQQTHK